MDKQFSIHIENRFPIVEKEMRVYNAFPTIVRIDNKVILAYRSGRTTNDGTVHGCNGKVMLTAADIDCLHTWETSIQLFQGGNELDAILSGPFDGKVFLGTRVFTKGKGGDAFLSCISVEELSDFSKLHDIQRKSFRLIADRFIACYGHIQSTSSGRLLMPGYGKAFESAKIHSPLLLASDDGGITWRWYTKLFVSEHGAAALSEFSMNGLKNSCWEALIRDETQPFYLVRAESTDDCRNWRYCGQTGLEGHAPQLIASGIDEYPLAIYRDLSHDKPGVALAIFNRTNSCWQAIARIAQYEGSIYDGGYGDVLSLGNHRYFAVYYLCDQDASPWIEGVIFRLIENTSISYA